MFRKTIMLCLVLTLAVIVHGAYVRLTASGLGCPDWPGCFGYMAVPDDSESIARLRRDFPDQTFDAPKARTAMFHRHLSGAVGLLSLLLFFMPWWQRRNKGLAVISCAVLLLLMIAQTLFGMWTVTMRVMPVTVVVHLLMGFLIAGLLFWMYLRFDPKVALTDEPLGPRRLANFAILIVVLQAVLGAWAGANFASLACPDFPTCQGSWWPEADYRSAFTFWRGMGEAGVAVPMSPEAQVALNWTHRIGALVTFLVLGGLILSATSGHCQRRVRKAGIVLSILVLMQMGLGIAAVRLALPLSVAFAHSALTPLMLLTLLYIRFYSRHLTAESAAIGEYEEVGEMPILEFPPEPTPTLPRAVGEVYVPKEPETLFRRLQVQLGRTRSGLSAVLAGIPLGHKSLDEEVLEEIEANLLMADVGVDATAEIIENLNKNLGHKELVDGAAMGTLLRENLLEILRPVDRPLVIPESIRPFVILVVGVNGVGKTTTIGKLAKRLQAQGHSVMLAAGDTFRAAAVEQLQAWGERNRIQVVAQHSGADSASVIFDAVQAAKARGVDVLIADTAGRLHTKSNLMEELRKIKRIMGKLDETAPHEVLLVLDAGTGQNALSQAELFNEAVQLTGLVITKLDGTAKGGVVFALAKRFGIPIRFIGIGEGIDDLQDFHAEQFVDALCAKE